LRLIATQILAENGGVKRCVSSPEMPMKKTSAKFVSAIFASILASSTLMAAPEGEKAADTCLLGPSASPPGGHWYYRVDRANKRNCWYLRQERERVARKPADEDSRRTEQAAVPAPPKKPVAQRSISDARAELPPPQTSFEQDTKVAATQRIPAVPVEAPRADNNQRAGTSDANLLSTAVAARPGHPGCGDPVPAHSRRSTAAAARRTAGAARRGQQRDIWKTGAIAADAADGAGRRTVGSLRDRKCRLQPRQPAIDPPVAERADAAIRFFPATARPRHGRSKAKDRANAGANTKAFRGVSWLFLELALQGADEPGEADAARALQPLGLED
jgi:hypothetical protein